MRAATLPPSRLAAAALVACAACLLQARSASSQGGVVFSASPTELSLDQAGVLEIRVTGAPESSGYQVEVGWDPSVVAITAVAPGDFLAGAGETVFTPRFAGEGRLVIGEVLAGAPASGIYPSGEGTVAYVTFAPLGTTSTTAITLADASMVGPSSEGIPAALTTGGQLTVTSAAAEPKQTAAVAQATALVSQLGSAAGSTGGGLAGDLASRLPTLSMPRPGSTAIWLGLLAICVLVVAISWFLGRRPPADRGPY